MWSNYTLKQVNYLVLNDLKTQLNYIVTSN